MTRIDLIKIHRCLVGKVERLVSAAETTANQIEAERLLNEARAICYLTDLVYGDILTREQEEEIDDRVVMDRTYGPVR
jgi:hypothetical protein